VARGAFPLSSAERLARVRPVARGAFSLPARLSGARPESAWIEEVCGES